MVAYKKKSKSKGRKLNKWPENWKNKVKNAN